MSARSELESLQGLDLQEMRRVARAFLQEEGDIPIEVFHQLGFVQHDQFGAWRELQSMRAPRAPHDLRNYR